MTSKGVWSSQNCACASLFRPFIPWKSELLRSTSSLTPSVHFLLGVLLLPYMLSPRLLRVPPYSPFGYHVFPQCPYSKSEPLHPSLELLQIVVIEDFHPSLAFSTNNSEPYTTTGAAIFCSTHTFTSRNIFYQIKRPRGPSLSAPYSTCALSLSLSLST